jgi:hypothetical protein
MGGGNEISTQGVPYNADSAIGVVLCYINETQFDLQLHASSIEPKSGFKNPPQNIINNGLVTLAAGTTAIFGLQKSKNKQLAMQHEWRCQNPQLKSFSAHLLSLQGTFSPLKKKLLLTLRCSLLDQTSEHPLAKSPFIWSHLQVIIGFFFSNFSRI